MKDIEKVIEYHYKDQAVRIGIVNDRIVVEHRVKRVGITPIWVQMLRIEPPKLMEHEEVQRAQRPR